MRNLRALSVICTALAAVPLQAFGTPFVAQPGEADPGILLVQRSPNAARSEKNHDPSEASPFASPRLAAREALRSTLASSRRFEGQVERCGVNDPMIQFHRCVADALEDFADELEEPAVALPEPAKPIPRIVRRAAAEVRAAPSRPVARAAVAVAVQEVRKTIELIRADDPGLVQVAEAQTRQGEIIVASLETAEAKLERAVGL